LIYRSVSHFINQLRFLFVPLFDVLIVTYRCGFLHVIAQLFFLGDQPNKGRTLDAASTKKFLGEIIMNLQKIW